MHFLKQNGVNSLLKLIRKLSPYKNNNKKNWGDAMRLYNIRSGELDMTINYGSASTTPDSKKNDSLNRWSSRLMLFTGGVLVVGNIPVYSSVQQTIDSPELSSTHITKTLRLPAAPAASYIGYAQKLDDSSLSTTKGQWRSYTAKNNDSIKSALANLQLSKLSKLLSKNTDIMKALAKLDKDSILLYQKSAEKVTQLIYVGKKKSYIISRSADIFTGEWTQDRINLNKVSTRFTISSSLANDAAKAKIPARIASKLPKILGKDANFKRIKKGDQFTVIYESIEFDGEKISSRNILAAAYKNKNNIYQRIRYTLNNGKTLFLSANGNDSQIRKTAFDRKPVNGRLSSHFNPHRRHPIFRTIRPHTGTDYAAPRGTPIHATADGVVKFKGRKGGYGNVIDLAHKGSITTRYGHMNGFKKGLHNGSRVKRGDVIGYVGSTGNSTGNHVHYEFLVRGRAVNSVTVKLPTVGVISKQEQRKFKKLAKVMVRALNNTKQFASVGADFSKQYGG